MNSALIDKIEDIRIEFETGKVSRRLLASLYSNYNPNVEIDSFLNNATMLFPALNCGLTSVYLQYKLGQGKVINGSYDGHMHTFLSVDGHIVDITADQFGGPKVYVGPLRKPWSLT